MDPFTEVSDAQRALQQELMAALHQAFIDFVLERRGAALKDKQPSKEDTFSGRVWTGEGAQLAGLVDGLGDMHAVLARKLGAKPVLNYHGVPKAPWWVESFQGGSAQGLFGAGLVARDATQRGPGGDAGGGRHGEVGVATGDEEKLARVAALALAPALRESFDVLEEQGLWARYGVR
jgi:ClpP class serine protease